MGGILLELRPRWFLTVLRSAIPLQICPKVLGRYRLMIRHQETSVLIILFALPVPMPFDARKLGNKLQNEIDIILCDSFLFQRFSNRCFCILQLDKVKTRSDCFGAAKFTIQV